MCRSPTSDYTKDATIVKTKILPGPDGDHRLACPASPAPPMPLHPQAGYHQALASQLATMATRMRFGR